ncbi:MAG: hypothetical protein IKE25_03830 [Clostridia bacterium]|jgi:hypothetical protein|nr:hypothetical protein [Clostridia bacterium]
MKKLFCVIVVLLGVILIACSVTAYAEGLPPDAAQETPGEPQQPFTWEQLATIAGATAAVVLIVQFLKLPLDHIWKIPTRIVVYIMALVILLIATAFTTGLTPQSAILTAVNAFIVALSAMGAYELTFKKYDIKRELSEE